MTRTDKWIKEFDEKFKCGFADYQYYEPEHQKEFEYEIKQFISQVQQDTKREMMDKFEAITKLRDKEKRRLVIQECIEVLEGDEELQEYLRNPRHSSVREALDQAITKLRSKCET